MPTTFAAEAAQGGAWVLHGHCDEEALLPYHAFAEALEQLVASAEGSLLAEHTADHGGDLCSDGASPRSTGPGTTADDVDDAGG